MDLGVREIRGPDGRGEYYHLRDVFDTMGGANAAANRFRKGPKVVPVPDGRTNPEWGAPRKVRVIKTAAGFGVFVGPIREDAKTAQLMAQIRRHRERHRARWAGGGGCGYYQGTVRT